MMSGYFFNHPWFTSMKPLTERAPRESALIAYLQFYVESEDCQSTGYLFSDEKKKKEKSPSHVVNRSNHLFTTLSEAESVHRHWQGAVTVTRRIGIQEVAAFVAPEMVGFPGLDYLLDDLESSKKHDDRSQRPTQELQHRHFILLVVIGGSVLLEVIGERWWWMISRWWRSCNLIVLVFEGLEMVIFPVSRGWRIENQMSQFFDLFR